MKIGILTFHNSDNYGAVLQTTGLFKKVKEINNDVEIIDYICPNKIKMYSLLDIDVKKSFKSNVYSIIQIPFKIIKQSKFKDSKNRMYKKSEKTYFDREELLKDNKIWSKVICGSDQIWNPDNTKFDTTYFIDFIKESNRKVSYAASFGVSKIDEKYQDKSRELLNGIGSLSVRETTGKKIVKELTGRECKVVLDPTLLLNKDEWEEFSQPLFKGEKYVLIYTLHNSKELIKQAEMISECLGYKIIKICVSTLDFISKYKCVIPNPYQYVDLINNAEWVITDSFHGTVFSINMNTNFTVFLNSSSKNNSRITNILDIVGLSQCVTYDVAKKIDIKEIDFSEVNKKLQVERNESLKFLKSSLRDLDIYEDK